MASGLEQLVWERARSRCEYCQIPAAQMQQTLTLDHIIALQHHGVTVASNLALACFPCNRQKGPNLAGIDPVSGKLTPLYHPRRDLWKRHFRWQGPRVAAKTAVGRVTLYVLDINHPLRVSLRRSLIEEGAFPPTG